MMLCILIGSLQIRNSISKRKEILSKISFKDPFFNSGYKVVDSEQEIVGMFENSKDIGHEGLVLKDPASQYHPGKKGRNRVNLKNQLETIDVVIIIAEYGHEKESELII